jgi:NADH-quinone oxidoreductase subunit J
MSSFLFYLFSTITVFSSFLVISAVNPVNSVLFLVLTFICSSIILFLLQLEFIPLMFIIVYVGAIAVLFLFIVMMLNIKLTTRAFDFFKYFPLGSLTTLFFGVSVLSKINSCFIIPPIVYTNVYQENFWFLFLDKIINMEVLGRVLYTNFFFFFLLAGIILLVAMIGSIVLTLQHNKKVKNQFLFRQLSRDSQKAIFLICNPQ